MVVQFVQGLEKFRTGNWSPPKISSNPMTTSELNVAKAMNALSDEEAFREIFEMEREEEEMQTCFEEIFEMLDEDPGEEETVQEEVQLPVQQCITCNKDVTAEVWLPEVVALDTDTRFSTEEKIQNIRRNWSILDSGLQIEYRCVKCRDCSQ